MAVLVSVGLPTWYANGQRLVRLSDGTLYCVYHRTEAARWQIYIKKSTDNGSTWTDETLLSTYAGMDLYHQGVPSIAVDSSNNLHVVWQGKATGFTTKYQIWYNKYDGAWVGPVRISDFDGMAGYSQTFPSIAVDGSDNLHVVWEGMATGFTMLSQIWYNKYDGAWAGPVRISDYAGMEASYSQGAPSIAVDSNDYIHVVWYGMAEGFSVQTSIWYNKYDGAWAGPVRISTYAGMGSPYEQDYPSVAVDSSDNVHVVWYGKATGYTGTDRIWYAKYVTSWGAPECVQTMGTDLSHPNLRWSRYPPSNRPAAGVDYVFTEGTWNIYWDLKDFPFTAAPTVDTNQATAVEATAATPNGTLEDDGGEACDCGFEWGETIAYGNTTPTQSRTTGQTFAQTITGLDPNKTYHFRAFATNAVGTSYGVDRSFTTLVAIPTVTTDPATGRGAIAATINGTLNQDGGEACECGFEWGLDTGYGTTTPPQSKTTGETFSQVIGGLFPNTTYHFRAFATNSVGTSYGADRSFATALVISRAHALAREEL